jgi:hypothetical protein
VGQGAVAKRKYKKNSARREGFSKFIKGIFLLMDFLFFYYEK